MKGKTEFRVIDINLVEVNEGQVPGLPANPRINTAEDIRKMKQSLLDLPELYEARGLLTVPYNGRFVVLGGNTRLRASKALGLRTVPCIVFPESTPAEKLKEIAVKDNGAFGGWDYELLANEWSDLPLSEWGVPVWDADETERAEQLAREKDEADEIERKRREFEDRMKNGEISEEDEEYQEFIEKFKLKKTTDDCYTPEIVHRAVVDFVAQEYGLNPSDFVRPFYPGGDYQNEAYPAGCVVVDNPPFSILAEILNFYNDKGVRFFLYAPTLTLFSSSSTAICIGIAITYANGANVNTSFHTNLEPRGVRIKSCPKLYRMLKAANDENLKTLRQHVPVYSYDEHIITAPYVAQFSRLGFEFSVPVEESRPISGLDSHKEAGKAIFGKGYLCSDGVALRRRKLEEQRHARELELEEQKINSTIVWELSDRERAIIAELSK